MTDTPQPDNLGDFLGFLEDDALTLPPIPSDKYPASEGGRRYVVQQPNAEDGQRITALGQIIVKQAALKAGKSNAEVSERDIARLSLSDDEEVDFQRMCLGSTYQQMVDDGVNHNRLKIAGQYAFVAFAFSEQQAIEAARAGRLSGKEVPSEAPTNRAQRRGGKGGKSKNPSKAAAATT